MTRQWALFLRETAALSVMDLPINLPAQHFSQIWLRRYDGDRTHGWFRDLVTKACAERFGVGEPLGTASSPRPRGARRRRVPEALQPSGHQRGATPRAGTIVAARRP